MLVILLFVLQLSCVEVVTSQHIASTTGSVSTPSSISYIGNYVCYIGSQKGDNQLVRLLKAPAGEDTPWDYVEVCGGGVLPLKYHSIHVVPSKYHSIHVLPNVACHQCANASV